MKRNDLLWKGVLEDLFDDFLRFFYPDAEDIFDFNRVFEYLDKELDQLFPPEAVGPSARYVDKLVKVFTRDGNEEWILVHVEVQGYTDRDFAKRMFQYYSRIFDQYDRPITAFAIFADSNKSFHPKHYERAFLGTRVHYSYNTYKIIDQNDAELDASNNPFAMAVLSAKLSLSRPGLKDQQLFELAYDLAKRLLGKQFSKEKIRTVMNFLRYYIRFDKPEMISKFVRELTILTERSTTMGIEELLLDQAKKEGMELGIERGLEKGLEKGKLEEAKTIALTMRNEDIPLTQIAKFTRLSIEEIEKL
jgi:predicted transposase/invertase (TIGR01784 family)